MSKETVPPGADIPAAFKEAMKNVLKAYWLARNEAVEAETWRCAEVARQCSCSGNLDFVAHSILKSAGLK